MHHFCKFPRLKLSALVLGALLLLSSATSARASYFYQVFEDGSPADVMPPGVRTSSGNSFSTIFSTKDFDIAIGTSFTKQNTGKTTLDTTFNVHLNPGSGTHTIELKLAFTGYTLPTGSPLKVSTSGTANFGDAAKGDFATGQTWANVGNTSDFNNGSTKGPQSATNPSDGTNAGLFMVPNPADFFFTPSGDFALNQDLFLSLSSTDCDQETSGQVTLLTTVSGPVVPAPAALLLVLSGTPVLGFWGWLRRRRIGAVA
jgi:hypothetical protein